MSTSEKFAHRALALVLEVWDAILEEEAILEETGSEPSAPQAVAGAMPDEAGRNQPHFEA